MLVCCYRHFIILNLVVLRHLCTSQPSEGDTIAVMYDWLREGNQLPQNVDLNNNKCCMMQGSWILSDMFMNLFQVVEDQYY